MKMQGSLGLLIRYLRPHRRMFFLLAFLIFVTIGLQIFNPQIVARFIDSATDKSANTDELSQIAILFLVLAVIQQASTVATAYVGENLAWSATNQMRHDLALHCMKLDMTFHKARTPGEMIERLDTDVSALANFFSQFVVRVAGNLLLLIGILIVMFLQDWRLGLPFTIATLITMVGLVILRRRAIPYWEAAHQGSSEVFGFLEERLAGTEDIRSSGANGYVFEKFGDHLSNRADRWVKAMWSNYRVMATIRTLHSSMIVMVFGICFYLFKQHEISLGVAYIMVNYTQMLGRPMREISNQIQDLQRAGGSILRVEELYKIETQVHDGTGATLPGGALSVAFDHVTFSYNDDKDSDVVLDNVDFTLASGKVLGLLGRTGAGKTTLSRLIFRLYDINEGVIRIGDVDIRTATFDQIRQAVGIVTQDVQIFRASVRDNLTFFDKSIPDAHILEVLEDLGMQKWLNNLPKGLDSLMESGGKSISAGEGQLLAFTRVFLKNPGLVIMDEASSRLDPATEQLIERAVDKLLTNRTGIIIAHRLKTVQRADEIMILEDGHIKEYGDRVALMANPQSHFAQLLETGLEEVLA